MKIKIFIDSANIDDVIKANEWGVIDGVTTNPTLIAKEIKRRGKNSEEIIGEIIDAINGPINVEVMSQNSEKMIIEAKRLSELSNNIVVKIPLNPEGLKALNRLKFNKIKTNSTLIFSVNQAILAAKAGADFVSVFVGRLDDIGHNGIDIVRDIVKIFHLYNIETNIIAASIRHPLHVIESAKAGTDIITIPFDILQNMFKHPLTDTGIEKFFKDYENSREK